MVLLRVLRVMACRSRFPRMSVPILTNRFIVLIILIGRLWTIIPLTICFVLLRSWTIGRVRRRVARTILFLVVLRVSPLTRLRTRSALRVILRVILRRKRLLVRRVVLLVLLLLIRSRSRIVMTRLILLVPMRLFGRRMRRVISRIGNRFRVIPRVMVVL